MRGRGRRSGVGGRGARHFTVDRAVRIVLNQIHARLAARGFGLRNTVSCPDPRALTADSQFPGPRPPNPASGASHG
jgi:hypothetical protein